jgi:molybdopterin molybdotransferase
LLPRFHLPWAESNPFMLTVEEALNKILAGIAALPAERVPLLQALGRVLAEDIFADIDNPPFDNSAVDGYAVIAADTIGASPTSPVSLQELGEVTAGSVSEQIVIPGTCIRVMTGAPMPRGANAMVMREDIREDPATGGAEKYVLVLEAAQVGDHVRRAGEDVKRGQRVLEAGTLIGSAEIAMLAAMGQAEVSCIRKPRVAVFSTGDELVEVSVKPGPGQIRDSNRYTLAALVGEAGGELHSMVHLPDDPDATEAAFRTAAGLAGSVPADVIVTSGGVSVGDRDYVKPALEKLGSLDLWRVKMKPGKPVAYGRIKDTIFFGLPGNPISTMVTFELFVRPALLKMAGHRELSRTRVQATLTDGISHHPGREEYVRALVTWNDGRYIAQPTGAQGSGVLTSMLGANGLLKIPEASEGLSAGDPVEILLISMPSTSTLQLKSHEKAIS